MKKRYKAIFLAIIPGTIFIWLYVTTSLLYLLPCITVSSYVLFFNLPVLVYWTHMRPVHWEDLEQGRVSEEDAVRYQRLFITLNNFMLSVLVTALVYYAGYQFNKTSVTMFESIGIVGGIIGLYGAVAGKIGSVLLTYLYGVKENNIMLELSRFT